MLTEIKVFEILFLGRSMHVNFGFATAAGIRTKGIIDIKRTINNTPIFFYCQRSTFNCLQEQKFVNVNVQGQI